MSEAAAPILGVIFDMDGVLIDSEPLHQRSLESLLSDRGHVITEAEYADLVGLSQASTWDWMIGRYGLPSTPATYQAEYEAGLLQILAGTLEPEPGALELVALLQEAGVHLALASSSHAEVVSAILGGLGLAESFKEIVSGGEVERGKPAPDIFLLAAERLGVAPASCVVIEDSVAGMDGACAAGMRVVGIRTRYTVDRRLNADLLVDSLVQLVERPVLERLEQRLSVA